jgi:hypothetical protein
MKFVILASLLLINLGIYTVVLREMSTVQTHQSAN